MATGYPLTPSADPARPVRYREASAALAGTLLTDLVEPEATALEKFGDGGRAAGIATNWPRRSHADDTPAT